MTKPSKQIGAVTPPQTRTQDNMDAGSITDDERSSFYDAGVRARVDGRRCNPPSLGDEAEAAWRAGWEAADFFCGGAARPEEEET